MNTRSRMIVIGIAVTFLLYAIFEKHYNFIVYILGLIGYFIWSHYREGTVFLATQAFHKQDYEKTKALLAEIKDPDKLRKKRRNYYEFMMGNIALKEERIDEAEYHFQLASRLPWKRDAEKGFVFINLANINLRKRNYDRVPVYIELASKLKLTERQKAIIEKIEKELNKQT
ncbi:FUSC family protein [Sphingobacterium phlebotomi]|uniref:FUSC family protein n=1 Tax=Sphingobacterium phlebotomi TaxID=2605433 RepID=A0A5D4HFL1_9SPHI|nr:FUSC family protein [Sphingobacterium phlebotomi]TYR38385.1 FUSC family protein [Sphingobacterium phlebotomi]